MKNLNHFTQQIIIKEILANKSLDRYKDNCSIAEVKLDNGSYADYVSSYNTLVAYIDHTSKTIYSLGYWSMTTSKHINYVAKQLNYNTSKL